jgi:peptide methionine sulfoxide reductase msrA/msrB
MKTIYLAGGCFWGVEKYLAQIPGVTQTEVGYANGKTANPTYEDVRDHGSGHAETVRVDYDPIEISLSILLEAFFLAIDPVAVNQQGADVGVQYRTGVYYTDDADQEVVADSLQVLAKRVKGKLAIEAKKLENYYPAEEYHQKYLEKNPEGYCHIGECEFDKLENYLYYLYHDRG